MLTGGTHIPKKDQIRGLVDKISAILDDKKALDVNVIDVSKSSSSLTDFLIIAGSMSSPHTNALAGAIEEGLRKMGYKVPAWQGKPESNWLILDLGSIIVHVMGPEERQKYRLEDIWSQSAVTYHI